MDSLVNSPRLSFLQGAFSDNSEPSSSRLIMGMLSLVVSGILCGLFYHLARVTDLAQLSLWLASTPILIASLIALMVAPYTINRFAGNVTDMVAAGKKGNDAGQSEKTVQ